jgi:hypothetical protein
MSKSQIQGGGGGGTPEMEVMVEPGRVRGALASGLLLTVTAAPIDRD